ncbi:MAG: S8 family serine peptidase [Bacteroidota bacterium]
MNQNEEVSDIDINTEITIRSNQNNPPFNIPIYSNTDLIVQFFPGTPAATKAMLRAHHGVINFEICQLCFDGEIELWTFGGLISIEPKKHAIEAFGGLMDVDYEFDFASELGDVVEGTEEDLSYLPLIAPTNSGVTIAILDTGFDPFFPFWYDEYDVPKPILYNATEMAFADENSGYDFVNEDHNAFDDHGGKHGTIIAYEIHNFLEAEGIPHQILPVKICDENGFTSYFKLLCGAKYVFERAEVVNMSLGFYDDGFGDLENTIFKNLLSEYSNVVVVTSAGNGNEDGIGDNNDVLAHYPSSYDRDNVIAVAATNADGSEAAGFSNYGSLSVDFWAAGEEIPFYDYEYDPVTSSIDGTSFAAPQVAAIAAKYVYIGGGVLTPLQIINQLNVNGFPVPFEYEGMVKYDKYFPMLVE